MVTKNQLSSDIFIILYSQHLWHCWKKKILISHIETTRALLSVFFFVLHLESDDSERNGSARKFGDFLRSCCMLRNLLPTGFFLLPLNLVKTTTFFFHRHQMKCRDFMNSNLLPNACTKFKNRFRKKSLPTIKLSNAMNSL